MTEEEIILDDFKHDLVGAGMSKKTIYNHVSVAKSILTFYGTQPDEEDYANYFHSQSNDEIMSMIRRFQVWMEAGKITEKGASKASGWRRPPCPQSCVHIDGCICGWHPERYLEYRINPRHCSHYVKNIFEEEKPKREPYRDSHSVMYR